jgi:hypothetical protein
MRLGRAAMAATSALKGILRLALISNGIAVLFWLAPEKPADQRQGIRVLQRNEWIERKLAVVHALGDDDFLRAVHALFGEPGRVGALARVQLRGGFGVTVLR